MILCEIKDFNLFSKAYEIRHIISYLFGTVQDFVSADQIQFLQSQYIDYLKESIETVNRSI